jgi:hypothetical protein
MTTFEANSTTSNVTQRGNQDRWASASHTASRRWPSMSGGDGEKTIAATTITVSASSAAAISVRSRGDAGTADAGAADGAAESRLDDTSSMLSARDTPGYEPEVAPHRHLRLTTRRTRRTGHLCRVRHTLDPTDSPHRAHERE